MKTKTSLLLLSVLVSSLTSGASSCYAVEASTDLSTQEVESLKPRVRLKNQILTNDTILFQPLHLKDPKTGEELLLAQHRIRGTGFQVAVALYNTKGQEILRRKIANQGADENYSWIDHARFDEAGNLIVIQTVALAGSDALHTIWSHNLTQGTSLKIFDGTERATVLGRVLEPTRALVAVDNERTKLFKSFDHKVDVIDESTGAVVRTVPLQQTERIAFGAGKSGFAKLIITDFDPSMWKTVDVASGAISPIAISEEEAHGYLQEQETVLGKSFQVQTESTLSLIDPASLFDGKIARLRTMPRATEFFGQAPFRLAMERTETELKVRDLLTGRQIGQTLPVNPAFPSRTKRDLMRGLGHVEDILLTKTNKVIVLDEEIVPGSFMPGTVLSYFDLDTGKLLRRQRLQSLKLNSQLVEDEAGHVLAIERDYHGSVTPKNMNLLVDLKSNQVIRELGEEEKYVSVLKARSNRLVAVKSTEAGKLSFADLKVPEAETLVGLPLGAMKGWTDQKNVNGVHSSTFRTGVWSSPNDTTTDRGWVEFSVR